MSQPAHGFKLFPFQEEAANALREAALQWVAHAVETDLPRQGTKPIPFVGQLKAVTGAGKTPVLAEVIGGLGDAVVIWTSKSSAVVEQTFNNLRGRYRGLLPETGVTILRDIPGQGDWHSLITAKKGLTIWILTTASWNEQEAARSSGAADARLNLHRPQPDWAGDTSPWEQLRTQLVRPLWIVSDESHNQTDTQLDQLHDLRPIGFFMASATPVHGELFDEWQKILEREPDWKALSSAGQVPIRTQDVVAAELLKTTIELLDFQSGTEESLDGALEALSAADAAVTTEGATVAPRAIYVVEQSNPPRGSTEKARPAIIWQYLVDHGVDPRSIAVFTDTRELPKGAEKVSSLSGLRPEHRHIIFNQSLQEGWDDPEAYVCYFDGTTKSFIRIRQIVGRVLRQPEAQRYAMEALNTATLILNTPTDAYDQVLSDLRAELRLYAPEDEPGRPPIRIKTRKDPLPAEPLRQQWEGLSLPRMSLRAPDMSSQIDHLRTEGDRLWPQPALDHPGQGMRSVVSLATESVERTEFIAVLRSARTLNGIYFRRRLAARNRNALNALDPDSYMQGKSFQQFSCQSSEAQGRLTQLANEVADHYENLVSFDVDPDPDLATWVASEHRPRNSDTVSFANAAHEFYSRGNFNQDELAFAQALASDGRGVWLRNADSGALGYSIPLPFKVGDSLRFFPDFLWWPNGQEGKALAIDTTGRHLINEKIRGKLVALDQPRVALVVRGDVDLDHEQVTKSNGWTAVMARPGVPRPILEKSEDLSRLLVLLAESVSSI
jgi:type III restriction enzyme